MPSRVEVDAIEEIEEVDLIWLPTQNNHSPRIVAQPCLSFIGEPEPKFIEGEADSRGVLFRPPQEKIDVLRKTGPGMEGEGVGAGNEKFNAVGLK